MSVPMTKDQSVLEKENIETARRIERLLDAVLKTAVYVFSFPAESSMEIPFLMTVLR